MPPHNKLSINPLETKGRRHPILAASSVTTCPRLNGNILNMRTITTIARYLTTPLRRVAATAVAIGCLGLHAACPAAAGTTAADGRYAASSVLAQGRWARVGVSETGMQFISNTQLRNLGFSDPSKVNVYGYGGRMIDEVLDPARHPDDLPQQPVVRTARGILFYGVGPVGITTRGGGLAHVQNPYSDDSYYYLSDNGTKQEPAVSARPPLPGAPERRTFRALLSHERDLAAPGNSGRTLLGEDFRTLTTQTFTFSLPDNTGDSVEIGVQFATRTTNGTSSILLSANGRRLPSTTNDNISGVTNGDTFMRLTTSRKTVSDLGDKLSLEIKYTPGGMLYMARLDWIEVEYTRQLRLRGGELHFYDASGDANFAVEGCDSDTQIWDVTLPHRPVRITYTLDGNTARFHGEAGFREYIAFDPKGSYRQVRPGGRVANQDIHSLPVPDMLIVSPAAYRQQAERIAGLHREADGMTVHVVTPEEIYAEFASGNTDASAIRKALKMWHDRGEEAGHSIRYCLIMSRPTYDNKCVSDAVRRAGYPRIPQWQSPDGFSQNTSYGTDDFMGMLEDCVSHFDIGSAKINVAVARMPVKSVAEATRAVDKLIRYVKEPETGSWRNNVMLIADDQDHGEHLDQAESVYGLLRSSGNGEHFVYERLYLDSYPLEYAGTGPQYTQAKQRFLNKLDEGVMWIDYIGHASPRGWTHENLFNWTDMTTLSNRRLPFFYTATCEFCRWDDDETSGAEEIWLNPDAGAIGMITTSRTVYISPNGTLNDATARGVFARDKDGRGRRVGDIYIDGKNSVSGRDDNKLRYVLMGDPALRLPSPQYNVVVESIDGVDISDPEADLPELKACGRPVVTGHIADASGNIIEDFNGIVEPALFDAERPIETYGNGKDGESRMYNDRKTRLFTGKAKVQDGRWTATLLLPPDIDNNYSPARLALYACSDDGREANGSTERLYVYGYDSSNEEDTEAPVIEYLRLNREDWTDGGLSSATPLVLAKVSDESGINLSESGIGHRMTLTLDSKTVYDDASTYFSIDSDEMTAGTLAYPLPEVTPGKHTLSYTVWDNANNSATATLTFNVSARDEPAITHLTTDANPARTSVVFSVTTDRALSDVDCHLEVSDLSGQRMWHTQGRQRTDSGSRIDIGWNLRDTAGHRLPRGIYIYRATLTSKSGAQCTRSGRLAVAAE